MPFFYISAAHKSSGKTTLSVGIAAALAQQGLKIQTFKKGPDYIDPLWLEKASGLSCYNLDFNTMSRDEIYEKFQTHHDKGDFSLIEGNKGLYDGVDVDGKDSNAAIAKLIAAPIILVLDCSGVTRGIAPLLMGYQAFDEEINIAGVILNKVAGTRHDKKLRAVIEKFIKIPVLGTVMRDNSLLTSERHLGLIPPEEAGDCTERLDQLAKMVKQSIDLELLKTIGQQGVEPKKEPRTLEPVEAKKTQSFKTLRIGIIRDSAFGFYYADDLEAFSDYGAELVFINALTDENLPKLDGLFIGGGFPETHLPALEKNKSLRQDLFKAGEAGLPIYAECGGLMYLSRSIEWQGQRAEMVGLIPSDVLMHKRPQGRGLVRLQESGNGLWDCGLASDEGAQIEPNIFKGHEFHYASLEGLPANSRYAFDVLRGHGITGKKDGILLHNIQANFSHLRHTSSKPWVVEFLRFVAMVKEA